MLPDTAAPESPTTDATPDAAPVPSLSWGSIRETIAEAFEEARGPDPVDALPDDAQLEAEGEAQAAKIAAAREGQSPEALLEQPRDAQGRFRPKTAEGPTETPATPPTASPEAAPSRYQLLDAEGKPLDGVRVQFKAAGEVKAYDSLEALVQDAQKGLDYERKLNELDARIEREVAAKEEDYRAEVKRFEDALLRAVYDDDYREQLQTKLASFRDPAAREAFEKAARFDREQAKRQQAEQQAQPTEQQQVEAFVEAVQAEFSKKLPEYPNLTPDDYELAHNLFFQNYNNVRAQLYATELPQLRAQGYRDEQIIPHLEERAKLALTEANLYAVMDRLNRRVTAPPTPPTTPPAPRPTVPPASRRQYVAEKLTQQQQTPTRTGGATMPNPGASEALPADASYEQKKAHLMATLRRSAAD